MVINGDATGTITNVTLRHNVIDGNYYSGLRFVNAAFQNIIVEKNTFFRNGAGSSSASRSELNLDGAGSGAHTQVTRNVIVAGNSVLNSCLDAQRRGFAVTDNVTQGASPSGAAGACVTSSVALDPQLASPSTGDFHAQAAGAAGYGAYAP